jgi:signal transduction histidine kinase
VENARLHQRAGEVAVYEDRDRLARDLHDGVIQRLFAIGLSLQGLAATPAGRPVSPALDAAIADIDETIRQVRATIFELGGAGNGRGIRAHVLALAEELQPVVGFDVPVEFTGAVDTAVTDSVADQLLPTLREALTNIGRHAGASRARIRLSMVGRYCRMEVSDNGKGFADARATDGGMGLLNMRHRAEGLGGTFEVTHPAQGGTTVVWQVPTFTDRQPAGADGR